jgi:tRNA (guanine-N7-)-methyltransferase
VRGPVRLPLEQLEPYLLTLPETPVALEWPSIFGNEQPVEIEVGCGKGLFLLTAAQERPDVNFLGIEIERKYQLFTANRLAKRQLGQVRVLCADARRFLRDYVAAGSVQAVHVYFPDPWWKTRHHKRRVFTEEFATACTRVLRPGGRVEVMSDVAEYFAAITELVGRQTALRPVPPLATGATYRTNFERKYRQAGKPIYAASYEKAAGGPAI